MNKFIDLLERNKYSLSSVYCDEDDIRFIECRTPKYQRTFMVYIPDKYTMTLPSGDISLKRLRIVSSQLPPSSRQIRFISDMKGTLLECDLLAVSSENLCMYRNDNESKCFDIKDDEEQKIDEEEEEQKIDDVTELEVDAVSILQKVNPGAKLPRAKLKDDDKKQTDSEEEEDIEEKDDGSVELVFEDDNGEIYDEVKNTLDEKTSTVEEELQTVKDKLKEEDIEEESDVRDNSLPNVEEDDIVLGIVYVIIDIGLFFKEISTYEDKVNQCYEQLDENELDIRDRRLKKIRELCERFLSHSEERLKKISQEEKGLKFQLVRLTVVLTQTEYLRDKVASNIKKYGRDLVDEIERIYLQTRKTIQELNMEMLRLRDSTDELLTNYNFSMEELLEL